MVINKDSKVQDDLTIAGGSGRLGGALGFVERLGNKLPNPFLLFVGLLGLIAVASTVVAACQRRIERLHALAAARIANPERFTTAATGPSASSPPRQLQRSEPVGERRRVRRAVA